MTQVSPQERVAPCRWEERGRREGCGEEGEEAWGAGEVEGAGEGWSLLPLLDLRPTGTAGETRTPSLLYLNEVVSWSN